jgi:hypothetical protein
MKSELDSDEIGAVTIWALAGCSRRNKKRAERRNKMRDERKKA